MIKLTPILVLLIFGALVALGADSKMSTEDKLQGQLLAERDAKLKAQFNALQAQVNAAMGSIQAEQKQLESDQAALKSKVCSGAKVDVAKCAPDYTAGTVGETKPAAPAAPAK